MFHWCFNSKTIGIRLKVLERNLQDLLPQGQTTSVCSQDWATQRPKSLWRKMQVNALGLVMNHIQDDDGKTWGHKQIVSLKPSKEGYEGQAYEIMQVQHSSLSKHS